MSPSAFDLVVVGAGSGGFSAALAASRLGLHVLLVEKSDSLGGNAARGGVNNWEPGVGGTGIPFDLYKRLKKIPNAIGIYSFGRHYAWQGPEVNPKYPGGELLIDRSRHYLDSLRRYGAPPLAAAEAFRRQHWHGVPLEPAIYAAEMEKMLAETGRCTVWKNTAFTGVVVQDRRITSLVLDHGRSVTAPCFIDATADVLLAQRGGCHTSLGQEPRSLYDEPSAPREPNDRLNGTTLIYRVSPTETAGIEPLPPGIPAACWWAEKFPVAACTQYPNGDFNINSLPTMAGRETATLGYAAAYAECGRRIRAHWHFLQTSFPEFQRYQRTWVAPGLGVREGPRLVGRYVLTEHDLLAGIGDQKHDDIIALADHAKDTHGADTGRAGCGELAEPYGIPYRCLLPVELDNLAVACRGASLSSVAASSCRLSRTMMQLGQAAGTAAAMAGKLSVPLPDVPPAELRAELRAQHVELTWPRPAELVRYLENEDA
ncbi:MAG: FAD-dependent oxidoreductase [Opitutus sp.]|nr:FAD-dependent oxidoreductase [Opitutus sp.]